MGLDEHTKMGTDQARFLTTRWTLIEDVANNKDNDHVLIGKLLNNYWKPVYCYLRRLGYDNEEAKDLTQAFFHEVVLGRGLFQRADKSQGRFRSFLLVALKRYVANVRDKEFAQKRIQKSKLVPLDMVNESGFSALRTELTPEEKGQFDSGGSDNPGFSRVFGEAKERMRQSFQQARTETAGTVASVGTGADAG